MAAVCQGRWDASVSSWVRIPRPPLCVMPQDIEMTPNLRSRFGVIAFLNTTPVVAGYDTNTPQYVPVCPQRRCDNRCSLTGDPETELACYGRVRDRTGDVSDAAEVADVELSAGVGGADGASGGAGGGGGGGWGLRPREGARSGRNRAHGLVLAVQELQRRRAPGQCRVPVGTFRCGWGQGRQVA
jgi:hypothetical protein